MLWDSGSCLNPVQNVDNFIIAGNGCSWVQLTRIHQLSVGHRFNISSVFSLCSDLSCVCTTQWPIRDLRGSQLVSSVAQSCPTLCDPMDCSTPGFPVHLLLLQFAQTHVHWVGDAIQPAHPLSSPSPSACNLSQHQGLFQWVGSSHQVAKVLKFQLQHQSFQWIFRTYLL